MPAAARRSHRFPLGTAVIAGSLGALAMFGTLATTGLLTGVTQTRFVETAGDDTVAAPSQLTAAAPTLQGVVSLRLRTTTSTNYGAGIVIDDEGAIVTTMAVHDGAQVTVAPDGESWSNVELVGRDALTGLSVLRLARTSRTGPTGPARVAGPQLGQTVQMARPGSGAVATGFWDSSETRVSSTNASIRTSSTVQVGLTTLTSSRRTGPAEVAVDTATGDVVALVTALDDNTEDEMSYAIPADLANRVGRQIVLAGEAIHGSLGIELGESPDPTNGDGVLTVEAVVPGTGAEAAGIQVGDELSSVVGRQVHTRTDVAGALLGHTSDELVAVVLRRDNRMQTVKVQLSAPSGELLLASSTTLP